MIVRRNANSAVSTDSAGTSSAMTTASTGSGTRSSTYTLRSNTRAPPANCRSTRNATAPSTSPASALTSDSAAAIRRTCRDPEPTRRSADRRRSRSAPAMRLLEATKMNTGSSSTTAPSRTSTSISGGRTNRACASPNLYTGWAFGLSASFLSVPT